LPATPHQTLEIPYTLTPTCTAVDPYDLSQYGRQNCFACTVMKKTCLMHKLGSTFDTSSAHNRVLCADNRSWWCKQLLPYEVSVRLQFKYNCCPWDPSGGSTDNFFENIGSVLGPTGGWGKLPGLACHVHAKANEHDSDVKRRRHECLPFVRLQREDCCSRRDTRDVSCHQAQTGSTAATQTHPMDMPSPCTA